MIAPPPLPPPVFDAYGTLLDFNNAVARQGAPLRGKGAALPAPWRAQPNRKKLAPHPLGPPRRRGPQGAPPPGARGGGGGIFQAAPQRLRPGPPALGRPAGGDRLRQRQWLGRRRRGRIRLPCHLGQSGERAGDVPAIAADEG